MYIETHFPSAGIGFNNKGGISILSCTLARQLCFEDPSCAAILEIIPRVCGPIPGEPNAVYFYESFEFDFLSSLSC